VRVSWISDGLLEPPPGSHKADALPAAKTNLLHAANSAGNGWISPGKFKNLGLELAILSVVSDSLSRLQARNQGQTPVRKGRRQRVEIELNPPELYS
jgi:hypothetical protein